MFCPKCGQQQLSDDTRFCSRCGLAIGGINDWLARAEGSNTPKKTIRARLASAKKEVKLGAKVMFFAVVLSPVFFGLSVMSDSPGPLYVPLVAFLAGSVLILYANLFGEETPAQRTPVHFGEKSSDAALPPASSIGINDLSGQRVNTAEIVQPPSVTDRTTKLLDLETPEIK